MFRHLLSPELLADATRLVLSNRGSAGIDQVTCDEVRSQGWEFIRSLQAKLRAKTYRPQAVLRAYIPKRDGKKRPLGIPAVEDRVVQRALVLLLEPIYEQIFLPCSHGFRPGRNAPQCAAEAAQSIYRNRYVIDADIKGFFDNVSHRKLMGMLKEQIVDPRILDLIWRMLRAGYLEEDKRHATRVGTPQGGPMSPLLANVYLHYTLDERFEEVRRDTGKRFALFRYADDFIVACLTETDLRFMVPLIKGWLGERGLDYHPEKSRAVDMTNARRGHKSKFDFLGFKFHLRAFRDNRQRYWIARQPSESSRSQLRRNIAAQLRPNLGPAAAKRVVEQAWYGWSNYFRYGNSNRVFYRECKSVRREVWKYLRSKYRKQRRPVPWRKLHPIGEYIFRDIRPVQVIPDSLLQRQDSS